MTHQRQHIPIHSPQKAHAETYQQPLSVRLRRFFIGLLLLLGSVYVILPAITKSVSVLHTMSIYLQHNGIDPSRYFYTDIEAVTDAENHMEEVMQDASRSNRAGN